MNANRQKVEQYFADANGTAIGASLSEETNCIVSVTSSGKLLAEEVASCLVSGLTAQFHCLPQYTLQLYTVSRHIVRCLLTGLYQRCGLRQSVLGQDRSETKKIGLGLAGLVLFCETRSCHARRHNDLEGYSNFSSTIFIVSLFCTWNSTWYCGDQQWHSLT